MSTAKPADERLLAAAVREYATEHRGLRRLDRDRTDVAVVLWTAGVCAGDIAEVCGVRPSEVPIVLAGKAVR